MTHSPPHDLPSPHAEQPVWDAEAWRELPQLREDVRADVCVVGLGGSGLACIGELLRAGLGVVGVDARDVGGGAAGRNGGFLLAGTARFHHDAVATHGRELVDLVYGATVAELDQLFAAMPDVARRTGSLRIAASEAEVRDCERQLESMRASGWPVEWYEGPEGRGLLIPTDGVFDPLRRCRRLAEGALEQGARLYRLTPVIDVQRGVVQTPHARVHCERVIVAVDGGLERLLPELAGTVRTARLQMLATAPAPEVRYPRPVYLRYGYEYWQQLPDGRLALGGFRDRGGEGEWTTAGMPDEPVQQELERFLREVLGVRAAITHRWAASVAFTPDDLPYAGEVRPGVWAIGAYSGTGNLIGTVLGREVARTATGQGTARIVEALARRRGAAVSGY